ncbi:hypothetical protein N658DRAFT_177963 [Parathielavia hyrcaniae]|uniref:Uncharacterized protein n=1 Tax=Parathielavia hyrcaniae TaxID=113614 RepID=A0AAN6Q6I1_9PEZI|nr:hypothetical protein N658DRAFT_177963 [Parathielavia hyrcaniae]
MRTRRRRGKEFDQEELFQVLPLSFVTGCVVSGDIKSEHHSDGKWRKIKWASWCLCCDFPVPRHCTSALTVNGPCILSRDRQNLAVFMIIAILLSS